MYTTSAVKNLPAVAAAQHQSSAAAAAPSIEHGTMLFTTYCPLELLLELLLLHNMQDKV
jgi:hypothetical protein